MKKIFFTSILFLGFLIANAQTAALSFVNPTTIGNKFRITLRMASVGGDFGLGTNNFRFKYNPTALANPVVVNENFPSPTFDATNTQGTMLSTGIMSINTSYVTTTPANSNALPITASGVDLFTVEFTILNPALTTSLLWNIYSSPKTTLVDDDKLTPINIGYAQNLNNYSLYFPTYAGEDVKSFCNTTFIKLTALGGIGNYTWSTGETTKSINVNPSLTTIYSVTSTDGTTDNVTVIKTNDVIAGNDITINCNNPIATLTANCGSGNYLWSTGETTATISPSPMVTTTYSVTSTDGSFDDVVVYVDNALPMVNAGPDVTLNCKNITTILNAIGDNGYYSWGSNQNSQQILVSPSLTTIYSLTLTGLNGCKNTDDLIVTVDRTIPTANAGPDLTVTCSSPNVIITLNGSSNYDYKWSDGSYFGQNFTATPLIATTYTLSVMDTNNYCVGTDEVSVFVDRTPPTISAGANVTFDCNSPLPITLNATTNGIKLAWSTADTTTSIVVNPIISTSYTVVATAANGCTAINEVDVECVATSQLKLSAKVFLDCVNPYSLLMDNYIATQLDFPLSDPYITNSQYNWTNNNNYVHVNNPNVATTSPILVWGNTSLPNSIIEWLFLELRQGVSGATTVVATKAALLQVDGYIVEADGSPILKFKNKPDGDYFITVRHRNHLGFRTANAISLSNNLTTLDFTNNSVPLFGATPLVLSNGNRTIYKMIGGDSNGDGSIDAFDTILWELQNGLFLNPYTLNADYNLDGSIDALDSITWELNNGKFQELD